MTTVLEHVPVRRIDLTETLHGVEISDPFRWMEDSEDPDLQPWIEAQNARTSAFLKDISQRDNIRARIEELWNYEKFTLPVKRGGRYFYTHNDGLQNQYVVYTSTSESGPRTVLLDPNTLSADGTVALAGSALSKDGKLLAYSISEGGSDWQEWRVRDVATATDLTDRIQWSKFTGVSWNRDGSGFFHSAYDPPVAGTELTQRNENHKVYFHLLGTSQAEDSLIYERPSEPELHYTTETTEDGRYLLIRSKRGTDPVSQYLVSDLESATREVVPLISKTDGIYTFVSNRGSTFFFLTSGGAPFQRLIAVDVHNPEINKWKKVIPERDEKLESVSHVGGKFIAIYLQDAHSIVRVYSEVGAFECEVSLPGLGTVMGFQGKPTSSVTYYSFTSFNTPNMIYRYNVATNQSRIWQAPTLTINPEKFVTEQVFYSSRDGARIPMFITRLAENSKKECAPTYLYGYGGFSINMTPSFSPSMIAFMEMGGIYCSANIRGGGEYGQAWHDGGRLENKQNCFDDFIAAAEWLIANGYTTPKQLAIAGGSNGGLLVGACINQRPELFGAALVAVGVMDMLRFHKFTIGWSWTSDFGSPDDPHDFGKILAYSPLHNIKPGTHYPATLITTGDHDDRVVPLHSYKYAATLQAAQAGDAPVLLRVETRTGHGAGKPTSMIIDEAADRIAFLVKALGM